MNFSEDFQRIFKNPKTHKKQFLNISEAFWKLSDIFDDFRRRRQLPEVKKSYIINLIKIIVEITCRLKADKVFDFVQI